jgi:hypothetical protein
MGGRDGRYARQISVREIGASGQAAISAARARVEGRDLDAEVCALYLAGAGIGRLELDPALVDACRALNREVAIEAIHSAESSAPEAAPTAFAVELYGERHVPAGGGPLERGARAARWVLQRALLSGGAE